MNFEQLLHDARGYLGLDDDAPVPRDELVEQAKANGYTEREIREAFRATDELENVGTIDAPEVRLADTGDAPEEEGGSPGSTPTPEADKPVSSTRESAESWKNADFATTEPDTYPPE